MARGGNSEELGIRTKKFYKYILHHNSIMYSSHIFMNITSKANIIVYCCNYNNQARSRPVFSDKPEEPFCLSGTFIFEVKEIG